MVKILKKVNEDANVLVITDDSIPSWWDVNNLGYFTTELALNTAHPTANNWNYAVVWTTDSIWIWDWDTSTWKNSWLSWTIAEAPIDWKQYTRKDGAWKEVIWWWDMLKSENLSWLANYAIARTNLWLNTTANQTDSTDKRFMTDAQENKLDWIEDGAEVNNISDVNATDLTDWWDTTLHTHDWRYYTKTETNTLLSNKVDKSTTITINWVTQDLSSDRSWTISTSWWLTYYAVTSSQVITPWNYYWVTCASNITLTLADWTYGQNLSIKKLDNTPYMITITGNIEMETSIVMDTQYESLDLFWNWTYYLIK